MQQPKIIASRFLVKRKISSGSFGIVYMCLDTSNQEMVAMKVEKEKDEMMSLNREKQILEQLKGIRGVPRVIFFGSDGGANCMAQQLLNRDLAHYMKHYKRFSLKCVVSLAEQLLTVLEQIHKRGVIHRDIKPENILTGREAEDSQQIYMVDYGVSKFFRDSSGGHMQLIHLTPDSPFRDKKPFIGTTRYASIAAHQGFELGRKDDLESLGYVFVFMLKGQLPWQSIQNISEKDKTTVVGAMKQKLENAELCHQLPVEFQRYFDYVKKLNYKQQPEYNRVAQQHSFQDKKFDWNESSTLTSLSKNSETHQQPVAARGREREQLKTPQAKQENGSRLHDAGSRLHDGSRLHNSKERQSDQGSSLLQLPQSNGKRNSSRHRSMGNETEYSGVSGGRSQISSIYMNYQASNISNRVGSPKKLSQFHPTSQMLPKSTENFQDLEQFQPDKKLIEDIDDDEGSNLSTMIKNVPTQEKHLKEHLPKN